MIFHKLIHSIRRQKIFILCLIIANCFIFNLIHKFINKEDPVEYFQPQIEVEIRNVSINKNVINQLFLHSPI